MNAKYTRLFYTAKDGQLYSYVRETAAVQRELAALQRQGLVALRVVAEPGAKRETGPRKEK